MKSDPVRLSAAAIADFDEIYRFVRRKSASATIACNCVRRSGLLWPTVRRLRNAERFATVREDLRIVGFARRVSVAFVVTISKLAQIAIRIEAASAVVERAGRKIDIAQVNPTEANAIDATLAVATAKVLTSEIALEASTTLFELAGTSSTRAGLNLDRHWRNARTHTLHDPVRWKYHVVGNYHLNGVKPPRSGAL